MPNICDFRVNRSRRYKKDAMERKRHHREVEHPNALMFIAEKSKLIPQPFFIGDKPEELFQLHMLIDNFKNRSVN